MKIEVSDDCVDEIMAGELVRTYKELRKDIKKNNYWDPDDLESFKEVFEALKVVGPFYVYDWKVKTK